MPASIQAAGIIRHCIQDRLLTEKHTLPVGQVRCPRADFDDTIDKYMDPYTIREIWEDLGFSASGISDYDIMMINRMIERHAVRKKISYADCLRRFIRLFQSVEPSKGKEGPSNDANSIG